MQLKTVFKHFSFHNFEQSLNLKQRWHAACFFLCMIDNFSGNVHLQTKLREIVEKAVCVALCGFKLGVFLKRDTSSSSFCKCHSLCSLQSCKVRRFSPPKNQHCWKMDIFLEFWNLVFCKPFFQNALICLRTKYNPVRMVATFQNLFA